MSKSGRLFDSPSNTSGNTPQQTIKDHPATMNPAPLPYQQAYQPVVAGQRRTKYALHKARLGLRIAATAIAVLAFILDIVGGVTFNPDNYYYGYYGYYLYNTWPIAGSTMVSDPLFFQSRPN